MDPLELYNLIRSHESIVDTIANGKSGSVELSDKYTIGVVVKYLEDYSSAPVLIGQYVTYWAAVKRKLLFLTSYWYIYKIKVFTNIDKVINVDISGNKELDIEAICNILRKGESQC